VRALLAQRCHSVRRGQREGGTHELAAMQRAQARSA
jgi:hypothetical protein